MGVVGTLGYLLIGCGPAAVIFATRIASRPFLVVLTFTSCASWILCATVLAVPMAFFLPLGAEEAYIMPFVVYVACHEACRRLMWTSQTRWMAGALDAIARHFGYRRVSGADALNMHLAWGLGQGIARAIFFFAANSIVAAGPGTLYTESCPSVPYFLSSALLSLAFVSIHTSVMVLDFLRELDPGGAAMSSAASAAPALAGVLTLGNLAQDGCVAVVPALVALALALVWHTVRALQQ